MAEHPLEAQLREELEDLHRFAMAVQRTGLNPEELEQRSDTLEIGWLDRIDEAEREAVRNIKPNMEALLAAQDLQIRLEENRRVSAIPDREGQLAYWQSHRTGELTPSPEAIEAAREQTQDRYSTLRDGMLEAVQNIASGKEPDLSFLLERQIDKEQKVQNALDEISRLQERERENER